MVPVECVVRGYITGSGWKDYQASGAVCGIELPAGLRESEQLPEPIFTPATKAELGDHDENVDFDRAAEIVGDRELLEELRRLSIAIYERGAEHARERGIILADTKFEFGRRPDGTIVLGDEVLTPDSSRFWPADGLRARPAASRASTSSSCATGPVESGWDKSPPAPEIPQDVVERTRRSTSRRTSGSPASPSSAGWSGPAREGAGARSGPRRGSSTPGPDRRAGAARARLRRREQRPRGSDGRARRGGRVRSCRRCASGCWRTR